MTRMTPSEQIDNYVITRQVADEARETRKEFRRLDAIEEAAQAVVNEYLAKVSIGSRVEAAVYRLRDALQKPTPAN